MIAQAAFTAPERERHLTIAGTLLFLAASTTSYIFPAYLSFLAARLGLDSAQIGMLAGSEAMGIAVMSLLSPFWVTRANRRLVVVIGVAVCVAGNIATALAGDYMIVLPLRLAIGLFGEGLLASSAFAVLGIARNVSRAVAIAITVTVATGAGVIAISSYLGRIAPAFGPLLAIILLSLAVLPVLHWLPAVANPAPERQAHRAARTSGGGGMIAMLLLALALWSAGPAAFWAFAGELAIHRGMARAEADIVLSLGILASLTGSLGAAIAGDRWGRFLPLTLATLIANLFALLYQSVTDSIALAAALGLYYAAANFGGIYKVGLIADFDLDGRAAGMIPAAQVFGLSIGPIVAGRWMLSAGDSGVGLTLAAFTLAGVAIYATCFLRMRRL